jgi:hypothetical protein
MKIYKEVNGTSYDVRTPNKLINILENCRRNNTRIILDYGDTTTGKSWNEVYDVTGRLGRSRGNVKVPILLHNSRSIGGSSILDHCIIGIKESKGGKVLYSHGD